MSLSEKSAATIHAEINTYENLILKNQDRLIMLSEMVREIELANKDLQQKIDLRKDQIEVRNKLAEKSK